MGTLKNKWGPNGDPKSEKGPHGDPGPQMGTHVGAVYMYDLTNVVDDEDDGKWRHINGCS